MTTSVLTPSHPVASTSRSLWQPSTLDEPPLPPPPDTREEQLAQLAAQEKLGHDGKRQRVRARRTIDPFGALERQRIYKAIRTHSLGRTGDLDVPFIRGQPSCTIDASLLFSLTNLSSAWGARASGKAVGETGRASQAYQRSRCVSQILPPSAYTNPSTSFCARYAHTSTNKLRCPVNIVT
ncbi:hypothetical protein JCM11641_002729, partial [Rhodosporidiobolus odoratus]